MSEEWKLTFNKDNVKISKIIERLPDIVVDSLVCQSYYIARCENCVGCSFAIDGCEKVVEMIAG